MYSVVGNTSVRGCIFVVIQKKVPTLGKRAGTVGCRKNMCFLHFDEHLVNDTLIVRKEWL